MSEEWGEGAFQDKTPPFVGFPRKAVHRESVDSREENDPEAKAVAQNVAWAQNKGEYLPNKGIVHGIGATGRQLRNLGGPHKATGKK